jgi:hypothetical protein
MSVNRALQPVRMGYFLVRGESDAEMHWEGFKLPEIHQSWKKQFIGCDCNLFFNNCSKHRMREEISSSGLGDVEQESN